MVFHYQTAGGGKDSLLKNHTPFIAECTWSEPGESPQGSVLRFCKRRFTEKTTGLFLCARPTLSPAPATILMSSKRPWCLSAVGTYEHTQEELLFRWRTLVLSLNWLQGWSHYWGEVNWHGTLVWMADSFSTNLISRALPLGGALALVSAHHYMAVERREGHHPLILSTASRIRSGTLPVVRDHQRWKPMQTTGLVNNIEIIFIKLGTYSHITTHHNKANVYKIA